MNEKLKELPLFDPATDSNPKNIMWSSVYQSGPEGTLGTYVSKRIREQNIEIYNYKEVEISASEILTCGTNQVELLSGPGVGKYYKYYGILEVVENTTPFDFADNLFIGTINNNLSGTIFSMIVHQNNSNQAIEFDSKSNRITTNVNNGKPDVVNIGIGSNLSSNYSDQKIYLATLFEKNATVGDMTFRVKIWYKIETFGTNI